MLFNSIYKRVEEKEIAPVMVACLLCINVLHNMYIYIAVYNMVLLILDCLFSCSFYVLLPKKKHLHTLVVILTCTSTQYWRGGSGYPHL